MSKRSVEWKKSQLFILLLLLLLLLLSGWCRLTFCRGKKRNSQKDDQKRRRGVFLNTVSAYTAASFISLNIVVVLFWSRHHRGSPIVPSSRCFKEKWTWHDCLYVQQQHKSICDVFLLSNADLRPDRKSSLFMRHQQPATATDLVFPYCWYLLADCPPLFTYRYFFISLFPSFMSFFLLFVPLHCQQQQQQQQQQQLTC